MRGSRVLIGTRGSRLALVQTQWVIDRLAQLAPGIEFVAHEITTTGDRRTVPAIGDGWFVKEIQQSLRSGEVDLAVHSLKDVPTEPVEGLVIAAVPHRADPREALVGGRLAELPAGSRVGTSSPRRAAQVHRLRPDVKVVPIRGNVTTRVEKVRVGEYDAAVLAAAGLERLVIVPDEIFESDRMLPAPGQGALAVESRIADPELRELVFAIDDYRTRASVEAERAALRALGGGCMLPVGALGRVDEGLLVLKVAITSRDGARQERVREEGDPAGPEEVALRAVARLGERGGLDLL